MDPREVLGVSQTASEEDIRAAYVLKLKEFPPDRSPEQFERIRDAYEMLRDARQRARHRLFSIDPEAPLAALLSDHARARQFVGPDPWREVLKGK